MTELSPTANRTALAERRRALLRRVEDPIRLQALPRHPHPHHLSHQSTQQNRGSCRASVSPSKLRKILYRFWGEKDWEGCGEMGKGLEGPKSDDTAPPAGTRVWVCAARGCVSR